MVAKTTAERAGESNMMAVCQPVRQATGLEGTLAGSGHVYGSAAELRRFSRPTNHRT